jgi:hypothetical protein
MSIQELRKIRERPNQTILALLDAVDILTDRVADLEAREAGWERSFQALVRDISELEQRVAALEQRLSLGALTRPGGWVRGNGLLPDAVTENHK